MIACIDFFVENSIEYVKVEMEEENMTSFESLDGTLRIVCWDYFKPKIAAFLLQTHLKLDARWSFNN